MVGDLSSSKTQFFCFLYVWLKAEIDAEFVCTVWYTCNMNSCTLYIVVLSPLTDCQYCVVHNVYTVQMYLLLDIVIFFHRLLTRCGVILISAIFSLLGKAKERYKQAP